MIDTSGAGDWCTSGMLYYLFDKDPNCSVVNITYNRLFEALRFGQALSALNCMAIGARGLAKALPRSKINKLAEVLQKSKLYDSYTLSTDDRSADSILREGWSNLISSRLNPKPLSNLGSYNRICCHTEL